MSCVNQRRKYIRIGTNLIAKVSNDKINRIVYIKNISANGVLIEIKNNPLSIGETMHIQFRYKNALYTVLCKVARIDIASNTCGLQLYFKNANSSNYNVNNNKSKLNNDILEEYFLYTNYF